LQRHWVSAYVKGADNIPAFLDSSFGLNGSHYATDPPPDHDAIPFGDYSNHWGAFCINRHDGGVNSVFLDFSVRKVGLKELWTLKWQPDFETRGPWTKAGGVKPEDWPEWMRGFKDY
jgi:prepilin-type processing-associated H-X9-DG protein